jgi:8-amino-7-oxononanoate synthase
MSWRAWAESKNAEAEALGRWRQIRTFDASGPRGSLAGQGEVVAFASNDYLGLSYHPRVLAGAHEALDHWGAGAGAARLITGTRPVHAELEAALAQWKGTEAALVFPTGYATNLGVLSALAGPEVLILSDALNHASIIDGCRLARGQGATVEVYPHRDAGAVAKALRSWPGRAVVVTDSLFSMDGDAAPVVELAEACAKKEALLVLDEAHAVLGPKADGLGCETLRVGTLSKALGSQGGFVAGRRPFIDMLVNRSRPFIFTTGLSPASAAAALAALRVLEGREGGTLLDRLARYASRLAPGRDVASPIIPFFIGNEIDALNASATLLQKGLFVPAIRPPSVPPGTSRLRVTVSAAHTPQEIDRLADGLGDLGLL